MERPIEIDGLIRSTRERREFIIGMSPLGLGRRSVGGLCRSGAIHTMSRHFDIELCRLKTKLVLMAAAVETQLEGAFNALVHRNSEVADHVIKNDLWVDQYDVGVEECCQGLLALHKPTAGDLRFITTIMKISGELERMSDLAVNIAERVTELNAEPRLKPYLDLSAMADQSIGMFRDALNAFTNRDAVLAHCVCRKVCVIDDLEEQLFRELMSFMLENPKTISRAARLMFIGKYYEGIAEHTANIAKLVVYMVEGRNVRHMSAER